MSLAPPPSLVPVPVSCFRQINPENYNYHRGLQCVLLQRVDLLALKSCDLPAAHVALTVEQVIVACTLPCWPSLPPNRVPMLKRISWCDRMWVVVAVVGGSAIHEPLAHPPTHPSRAYKGTSLVCGMRPTTSLRLIC